MNIPDASAVLHRSRMDQRSRARRSGSGSPTTPRTHSATSCTSRCPPSAPRSPPATRFSEVESTKSVSRHLRTGLRHHRRGQRRARPTSPRRINSDPYGAGWICEIELADPAQLDGLLDARGVPRAHRGLESRSHGVRLLQQVRASQPARRRVLLVVRRGARLDPPIRPSRSRRSTRCQDAPGPADDVRGAISTSCRAERAVARGPQRPAGRRDVRARGVAHPSRPSPRQRDHPRRHHRVAPPRRDRAHRRPATSSAMPARSTAPT